MSKKYILFFCILHFVVLDLDSQMFNSPYSVYGIGDVEYKEYGMGGGMGNCSIGIQSKYSINNGNPASYAALDSLMSVFDFSICGRVSRYTMNDLKERDAGANYKKLALSFRLSPKWATSIGIVPFSSVGYRIGISKNIAGEPDSYTSSIVGSGGINKFYWGNSFRIFKGLSIGINTSYLFGNIKQSETFSDDRIADITTETQSFYRNFHFDYGMQYSFAIAGNTDLVIGGIFGNKQKLLCTNRIYSYYSSLDSIRDANQNKTLTLPLFYGSGISACIDNKYMIAFDYRNEQWSDIQSINNLQKLTNSNLFSAGFQYTPAKKYISSYFELITLRAGFSLGNTYLIINNHQVKDRCFTFGVGLPVKEGRSNINISFEIGKRGVNNYGLLSDNYFQIKLNLSLREIWFQRSKYD